ncbi:hypothetical protein [Sorangium sp. So ce131]|uniref:hypothetical protein n=1 Tax=Sorangium sp. So ce131 TaxID=3133282 RepID=UPI003F5EAAB1
MRSRDVGLLGLGAFCAMALLINAGGCQAEGGGTPPTGPTGASGSGGGGAGTSSGDGGGDQPTTSGTGAGTGTGAGSGGGGAGGGETAPQAATIEEITTGAIPRDTVVELKGVVAMSQKFYLDDTRSGDCLWGVFLSSPGLSETAANSGILAVSRSEALTGEDGEITCPRLDSAPAGDAFPDDVAPGDLLDVVGETTYFNSNSCHDGCGDLTCDSDKNPPETADSCRQDCGAMPDLIHESDIGQYQIEWIRSVTRTGRVDVPEPHVFTPEEAMKLNSPTEIDFHHKWGGVKVRLEGSLAPELRTNTSGQEVVVGPYGNIHLQGGPVQVGNKIYYIGGSQDACHQGPVYSDVNTVFSRVDGFVYKNFCIWSLQVTNKCADVAPPSEDCIEENLTCP